MTNDKFVSKSLKLLYLRRLTQSYKANFLFTIRFLNLLTALSANLIILF
ncbi:hypothetical protein AM2_0760 [Lactococcus cremoris]|nr:hypothetical protein llh_9450 [Lactococcus cremoris subsp. cremoris A76]KZK13237.1 hypothetical protein AB995_0718 [Lactococcus cremoris]KZK41057.1 hypothetical protein B40_2147 [Lactococcus cremoris]KZK41165.1 hypothetical protein LMG6897_1099 [Lactococcus cremoris]KZK49093.1 hypothetical protein FG2_0707 [Lactococcus cremoris]